MQKDVRPMNSQQFASPPPISSAQLEDLHRQLEAQKLKNAAEQSRG